jgi:glycosyltransferase involved in cell wall biosynthesis
MKNDLALAFVGHVVPEEARFQTDSFSRGGQMLQANLLLGLKRAGIFPSAIISSVSMRAYPRSRCLWFSGKEGALSEGLRISLVPFLNVTPFKQLTIGVATALLLIQWAWHHRGRTRVILTYNLTVPPGAFTWLAAKLVGAKTAVALYDIEVPGQTVPNSFWYRLDFWLQRWLIPRFDAHVTVTDCVMRDFAPDKNYLRLEGGISQETLDQFPEQRDEVPDNFTIVAAGLLNETNGIPEILAAFSLLQGDFYRLIIAGDGPLRKLVEDAANNDQRIQYMGYLQFADVLELYKKASVLVCMRMTKKLNTKYFFPSKLMEYLASGVPVVSTCTNHLEEEFGEFLYLLRNETPEGLAELIRQISCIDPGERRKLGQKARAFMAANKTWDAQGQSLAAYLSQEFATR